MIRDDITIELLIPIELLPGGPKEALLRLATSTAVRVYVVARTGYANDWSAYIGYPLQTSQPHEYDMLTFPEGVASNGDKLDKATAEALFPYLKERRYRS